MGIENIAKTIRESCQDDHNLEELLIRLLNYNFEGKGRYKDDYKDIIAEYAEKMPDGVSYED